MSFLAILKSTKIIRFKNSKHLQQASLPAFVSKVLCYKWTIIEILNKSIEMIDLINSMYSLQISYNRVIYTV